jgi:hypothetical protein
MASKVAGQALPGRHDVVFIGTGRVCKNHCDAESCGNLSAGTRAA